MSHPANRGDRRRLRQVRIQSRIRVIPWARCKTCYPAPCHCHAHAVRRGRLAKTPVPCSCCMCGNPRCWVAGAQTLQERRASLKAAEQEE